MVRSSLTKLMLISFLINSILFGIFIFIRQYQPLFICIHLILLFLIWAVIIIYFVHKGEVKLTKKELFILAGLFIIAVIVGLYNLTEITPGMYGDEVSVAVQSLQLIQQKELPPFLGAYSHPTPLLYVTAASIQLLGHTTIAIRLPSIIFGALTVVAFYILLRMFFQIRFALCGAVLMLFQYTHIIISRLAYESSASLFFQILVLIFFVLYQKTKKQFVLIVLGLLLGSGLYTYLNFRPFAALIFIVTILSIWKRSNKKKLHNIFYFCSAIFIAVMPLLSYAMIDPHGFFGRVGEISLFSRGYSVGQLLQELWGNISRSVMLPFIGLPGNNPPLIGDPNPGKNPSGVMLFDPLTTLLAIIGLAYLFKEKRQLFWFALLLFVPPYMSDIFSSEVIPGVHYYGLGHPNALRLSGIIPLVLFAATVGVQRIYQLGNERFKNNTMPIIGGLVFIICLINWHWYFDQQNINRKFYLYNYIVNHADVLQMISYFNSAPVHTVQFTNALGSHNDYIHFFLKPTLKASNFNPTSADATIKAIKSSDATAIEINANTVQLINALINNWELQSSGYVTHEIRGIVDQPDIMIFEKDGT